MYHAKGESIGSDASRRALNAGLESGADLSILIVSRNSRHYLAECLSSVLRFAPSGAEVILVDNASTDGSVEFVAREYPWVQIVCSARNLGFSAANNVAARKATGRFFLLLNPDTVLIEPIAPAVEWLNGNADYAVLTIDMLDTHRVSQACTGRFPSLCRLVLLRSLLAAPCSFRGHDAYDVDWVQGSFLLARAEHWRIVGGLDESYFMYVEDVDLCKRLRDLGLKCAYLPHIQYIHLGGYSSARFPEQARSLRVYLGRHMSGGQKFLALAALCTACLARVAVFRAKAVVWRDGISRTTSRASWLALKGLLRQG